MSGQNREAGIYIKGDVEGCTEDDFMAEFASFGEITEVFLKSRWALVQYTTASSAAAAAAANVQFVGGVAVEVSARTAAKVKAAVPDSVNIYLNNLNETASRDAVVAALEAFGEVTSVKLETANGYAYAAMDTMEAAQAAVAATPLTVGGCYEVNCEMRRSNPRSGKRRSRKTRAPKDLSKEIYIKGLNPETAEEFDIENAFAAFGTVTRVSMRADRDFAFVTFEDAGAVAAAVASGGVSIGGCSVVVEARTGKARTPAATEEIY